MADKDEVPGTFCPIRGVTALIPQGPSPIQRPGQQNMNIGATRVDAMCSKRCMWYVATEGPWVDGSPTVEHNCAVALIAKREREA